jgi:hypothetical protein
MIRKQTKMRLTLDRQTMRRLTDRELDEAAGGAPTTAPTSYTDCTQCRTFGACVTSLCTIP